MSLAVLFVLDIVQQIDVLDWVATDCTLLNIFPLQLWFYNDHTTHLQLLVLLVDMRL